MDEIVGPGAGGERTPEQATERTTTRAPEGGVHDVSVHDAPVLEGGAGLDVQPGSAKPARRPGGGATAPGATAVGATASGASAIGAAALGALAVGALAVGAVAIGRLAIGRFAMKRGRVRSLTIDDLEVGRLRVGELNDGVRSLIVH